MAGLQRRQTVMSRVCQHITITAGVLALCVPVNILEGNSEERVGNPGISSVSLHRLFERPSTRRLDLPRIGCKVRKSAVDDEDCQNAPEDMVSHFLQGVSRENGHSKRWKLVARGLVGRAHVKAVISVCKAEDTQLGGKTPSPLQENAVI